MDEISDDFAGAVVGTAHMSSMTRITQAVKRTATMMQTVIIPTREYRLAIIGDPPYGRLAQGGAPFAEELGEEGEQLAGPGADEDGVGGA